MTPFAAKLFDFAVERAKRQRDAVCMVSVGDLVKQWGLMPKISEMREGKFLKKEDVGRGALGTIEKCVQMNVAMEGAGQELKWCLMFTDIDKPLVLNGTNIQLCAHICGSDDTDHWVGKKIVLYTDPTVMYAGKMVGGIRVRAPKPVAVAPVPAPVAQPLTDDDIPF